MWAAVFDLISQLYLDVRNEADASFGALSNARDAYVILAGGQMIWAFAREAQPAFPAVACLRIQGVGDQLEAIVQTRCEGAKDACDAVDAKARGKDWSNLFGD